MRTFPLWPRSKIYAAIDRERDYQDCKAKKLGWKEDKSAGEFLLVMMGELQEAHQAWLKGTHKEVMQEILQVISVGVAAIEHNGLSEREFKINKKSKKKDEK